MTFALAHLGADSETFDADSETFDAVVALMDGTDERLTVVAGPALPHLDDGGFTKIQATEAFGEHDWVDGIDVERHGDELTITSNVEFTWEQLGIAPHCSNAAEASRMHLALTSECAWNPVGLRELEARANPGTCQFL